MSYETSVAERGQDSSGPLACPGSPRRSRTAQWRSRTPAGGRRQAHGRLRGSPRGLPGRGGMGDSVITDGSASRTLPGYFRATKRWDLLVVSGSRVLAAIELKSISSSFANNLNWSSRGAPDRQRNRLRDGVPRGRLRQGAPAVDRLRARDGREDRNRGIASSRPSGFAAHASHEPSSSMRPTSIAASSLCRALVQERLCDAAWLLVTSAEGGPDPATSASPPPTLQVRRSSPSCPATYAPSSGSPQPPTRSPTRSADTATTAAAPPRPPPGPRRARR